MGCIYMITNIENGKKYIGQTINLKKRIWEHFNGKSGSPLLKKAITKYGKDAFIYETLHEGITPKLLDSYEIEAIKTYNTQIPHGYNFTGGGRGSLNMEIKVETRRKISEAGKGRKRTLETRRKISDGMKGEKNPRYGKPSTMRGRTLSEESRKKISDNKTGKKLGPQSAEHRKKIGDANRGEKNHNYGKTASEETRRKMRIAHKGRFRCPEAETARTFYFSLSKNLSMAEKRKRLRDLTGKGKSTIYRWTNHWENQINHQYEQDSHR